MGLESGDVGIPLIKLQQAQLSVPTLRARPRNLLVNPMVLLSDLYFSRGRREAAQLLSAVDLEIFRGDRLAVLGRNGAGKSTLLRLIGGVYEPSAGTIEYDAHVMGFFSTQNGILQEATGLENIYLRGLELGFTLAQIRDKVNDIVAFSGLKEQLNQPVYTYSAGMKLRLAVAVTFSVQPEVLLLDEWIGAGDAEFRDKISARLNEIISHSKALVIASHNHALLRQVCNRAIVLSKGRIIYEGGVPECVEFFRDNQLDL